MLHNWVKRYISRTAAVAQMKEHLTRDNNIEGSGPASPWNQSSYIWHKCFNVENRLLLITRLGTK
jgi:hypothetical protein